jgi:hypothetical protein
MTKRYAPRRHYTSPTRLTNTVRPTMTQLAIAALTDRPYRYTSIPHPSTGRSGTTPSRTHRHATPSRYLSKLRPYRPTSPTRYHSVHYRPTSPHISRPLISTSRVHTLHHSSTCLAKTLPASSHTDPPRQTHSSQATTARQSDPCHHTPIPYTPTHPYESVLCHAYAILDNVHPNNPHERRLRRWATTRT